MSANEQASRFSDKHTFTLEEVEEAATIKRSQAPWQSKLVNVTTAHRTLAGRQFIIQQIAYWATVLGLAVAVATTPGQNRASMGTWLVVSFVSWLVRVALFLPTYYVSPAVMAKSVGRKILPLLIIIIACGYWIWTLLLFVGPELTVRELLICAGFITICISMTALWPVTPAAVVIYNVVLWGAFSSILYIRGAAEIPAIIALNLTVIFILWIYIYISVRQVEPQMARSDEADIANEKLRQANKSLKELQEKTQRTLAMRSVFFAGANHDLKQRLHGTKLRFISARAALRPYPEISQALNAVSNEIDSLEEYMGALLEHAKIESLDMEIQLRTIAIQTIFQKLDMQFEKTAQSMGVPLTFRFTTLKIGTDAALLHRILENLISNALKFTRGRVLVTARKSSRGILIQVWDQGPGIKPDAHERIFEAFHQESDNPGSKGYGLGLSIVKLLADGLGYKIKLKSALGRGTCFTVVIPDGFAL